MSPVTTKPLFPYTTLFRSFRNNISCQSSATTFTDSSYSNGGTITQWWWKLDNGQTSTQQNPTTTYTITGTYIVKLVVKTNCVSDTFSRVITVNPKPVANFS